MGMIRKTLSIGTFGAISFRSKKEKLRRAEGAQRATAALLEQEHSARTAAESRTNVAKKRQRRAERRNRRLEKRETTIEVAAATGRAARRAKKAAKRSMVVAKDTASSVRDEAAPHVHAVAERTAEMIEHLTSS